MSGTKTLLVAFLAASAPTLTNAAILVDQVGTPEVLTFDQDYAGVVLTGDRLNNTKLTEPDSFFAVAAPADRPNMLVTTGATLRYGFANGGAAYGLGADSNTDGDTTDLLNFNFYGVWRPTDSAEPAYSWNPNYGDAALLQNNAFMLSGDGDFATGGLYLRIQNTTGQTVTDWRFQADAFYNDDDSSLSTFTWGYTVDGGLDVDAMSFTDLGATPAITTGDTLATAQGPLDATVAASVADGDYVVLAFEDATGSGSTIFLDNIQITAVAVVPEPSFGIATAIALAGGLIHSGRRRID